MPVDLMKQAVQIIRDSSVRNARGDRIKIEASGNINLDTLVRT